MTTKKHVTAKAEKGRSARGKWGETIKVILDYVSEHEPSSTEAITNALVAKGVDVNRNIVHVNLSRLKERGDIHKTKKPKLVKGLHNSERQVSINVWSINPFTKQNMF